jgi:Flp pilus assembly protein TadG
MARQQDRIIEMADFRQGFTALDDTTKAPFGSFRRMRNARVTDRAGIGPRPGTLLLGTKDTSASVLRGLYNYKKSFESNEILVRAYDDELEGYSKDHATQGFFRIKNSFTADKEFGFVHSLFNTSNENYLIGCNRFDKYFAWTGAILTLNGALAGSETALTVDTTLRPDIYESQTATSSSATTLTVSSVTWAASQWVNFYVYITSGIHSGKVRKITANTSTQITFTTLGSDPGSCSFEIRQLLIPLTGTVIYGGTTIAYTDVPTATTITVASAHAAADNTIVTLVPTEYESNPRGNRFTNYLGRTIVGNVRSALSRDSGGTLQGYASGGSYFVSKLNNPLDYSFAATRAAGEGDIQATPYGGGDVVDVIAQEDAAYIFKKDYIEAVTYSQDSNDRAIREPLKTGVGSVGKVTIGDNDVYFMTNTKQFTSLGRVKAKDLKPEAQNIGNKIKRWLEKTNPDEIGRGIELSGKLYIPMKSNDTVEHNDVMLIYNTNFNVFEGIWDLGAFGIMEFNDEIYYGSSNSINIYQMFTDRYADVEGSEAYGYTFDIATHYFNLTAAKSYMQAIHGMVIEGYIRGGTTIMYKVWKDFLEESPIVSFTLASDETGYLDGEASNLYVGDVPIGLNNLSIDYTDIDANTGMRHFSARVYFPFQYGNYFSVGIQSSGVDQEHETSRIGLFISEEPGINMNRIKSI